MDIPASLSKALEKVKQQRELITENQLSGRRDAAGFAKFVPVLIERPEPQQTKQTSLADVYLPDLLTESLTAEDHAYAFLAEADEELLKQISSAISKLQSAKDAALAIEEAAAIIDAA